MPGGRREPGVMPCFVEHDDPAGHVTSRVRTLRRRRRQLAGGRNLGYSRFGIAGPVKHLNQGWCRLFSRQDSEVTNASAREGRLGAERRPLPPSRRHHSTVPAWMDRLSTAPVSVATRGAPLHGRAWRSIGDFGYKLGSIRAGSDTALRRASTLTCRNVARSEGLEPPTF